MSLETKANLNQLPWALFQHSYLQPEGCLGDKDREQQLSHSWGNGLLQRDGDHK